MADLELVIMNGVFLGEQEHYGHLDEKGNFVESLYRGGYRVPLWKLNDDLAIPVGAKAEILNIVGRPFADLYIGVVNGRVVCKKIEARDGDGLSSSQLRMIPIATLVLQAAEANVVYIRDGFAVRFPQGHTSFSPQGEVNSYRRRTLNADFLQRVALIYRSAMATGKAPAIAVEETLGPTTPENARRWIATARREGFLAAAPGAGRKGEASPHSRPAER